MTGRLAGRAWMIIVAVVVVGVAAFTVYRLQRAFGSHDDVGTLAAMADQIVAFNPKRVRLEVFGEPGATATITFLDVNARPQRVDAAALPWSYDDSTTTPAVLVSIQAQGDGNTLGCRITIDDVVKEERLSDTTSAYVFCLDKSG